MSRFALSLGLFRSFLLALLSVGLVAVATHADTVSFDTSVWDNLDGNGPQVGWSDGRFLGITEIGIETLAITSSDIGTATYTADHFSRIDATFFSGFAFQLDPSSTVNTTSFDNYARYDFSFSFPVQLDSFTLTDVDRTDNQWYDIVAAEGFSTQVPGAVGAGFDPNYSFAAVTNMEEAIEFGLLSARPLATSGNVQNTISNDVTFNFSEPIQSFSIYHWNQNGTDDGATTQTIGIRGNEFEISLFATSVPEPSGLSFLAVATVGLAGRRRRSRSA